MAATLRSKVIFRSPACQNLVSLNFITWRPHARPRAALLIQMLEAALTLAGKCEEGEAGFCIESALDMIRAKTLGE